MPEENVQSELKSVILDNSFDSIICYEPVFEDNDLIDFRIVYMNNTALVMLAGDKKEHIGESFLKLFPYSKINGLFEDVKKVYETGSPLEEVYYYENPRGKGWSQNSIVRYENKIIIYFRNVTELMRLELELEKKNYELELLMREVNHRVKNNLQIIASILKMERETIRESPCIEILDLCSMRIKTMAMIHSRLYEEKNYTFVNLKAFISEVAGSIINMFIDYHHKIELVLDLDELEVNTDNAVKIGLIANELITNSFKYAFSNGKDGRIIVELKNLGDYFSLKITDNGAGLPSGFNFEETSSLGMTLVKSFTEQMDGTVDIIKEQPGTTFLITLPKNIPSGN
jgi:two-component sensor histidine kinase